jgi:hypothetical protein
MRRLITALLLAACLCTTALPHNSTQDSAQTAGKYAVAGLDDEREVEDFFLSFKDAVARNDKAKVASMVSYPVYVRLTSGRSVRIRNARAFVKSYDAIFGKKFKQLISQTEAKDLWAKWSGVATPRGEVWFNGISKKRRPDEYVLKITSINGPVPSDN